MIETSFNNMLFRFGYQGRANIYEYWNENKEKFYEYLQRKAPRLATDTKAAEEFELKVRWCSPVGLLIKSEIRRQALFGENVGQVDFHNLKVRYGKRYVTIDEFLDSNKVGGRRSDLLDLRGISIIRSDFQYQKFENIDFRYAKFDLCRIEESSFNGCLLEDISFRNSSLVDCDFDEGCTLNNVDFQYSELDFNASCDIGHVEIKKIKPIHAFDLLFHSDSPWLDYTVIRSIGFLDRVKSREEANALLRQYYLIKYSENCKAMKKPTKVRQFLNIYKMILMS